VSTVQDLPQDESVQSPLPKGSGGAAFALTGIAFLAFVAFVFAYARWGGPWVDALPGEIGEVMADEAARLAHAGETDAAVALYQRALESRFDHESRRAQTRTRLAALLTANGDWAAAIPHLREAAEMPRPALSAFPMLHTALMKTSNASEAVEVARRWRQAAEQQERPGEAERARHAEQEALNVSGDASDTPGRP